MTQEELDFQSLMWCLTVPDCRTLLQDTSLGSCPVLPQWGGTSLLCPGVLLIHQRVNVMFFSWNSHLDVPLVTLCILHVSSSFLFVSQVLSGSWWEAHGCAWLWPRRRLWCWSEGPRPSRAGHPHQEGNVLSTHAKQQKEEKACHF